MRFAPPRRVVPGLAVAVAALLVAGVAGAVVVDNEEAAAPRGGSPATTSLAAPTSATGPTTTAPSAIQALVPELQAFVEQERGLRFKGPVKVSLLDGDAFRARLLADEEEDQEELDQAQRVLRALHLIERELDLRDALEDLLGAAVAGFYDAETKELVVRGAEPTAYVRSVLVHELTHALQDQHFQLHRPALDEADDESGQGFSGLLEGDAVRIQEAYLRSLPSGERRQARREEASYADEDALDDVPEVLLNLLSFPYATGPQLVAAILRNGGQARLDAAFGAPPSTSEHLLHPETYLAGQALVPVTPPPAGGKVIDQGVVGELGLLLMFQDGVDEVAAVRGATGWGGDWYVAWDDGDRTCVRATFVMDTPADTSELQVALRQWADEHGGVTLSGEGPMTLTSCN